ncbi:MAG TPA: acyl-CoA dehydrogenase family protein [Bryobacteraceae bacterium]|jgi:alkylation response protein AidB-like acyl-CoA dehydrogenase|nr:acyl-CoA dehydrogenase family protein [Bryobacteraceae bacterium]
MQFGLTETQQVLKNSARKFFSAECPIAEVRRLMETDTAYDAALWQKMADQGWTGMIFDEEYGGLGLGLVEMAVALEEMGRALLPGPYLSTVLLAGGAIAAAGNRAQKRKYLSRIATGEAHATLALLEGSASWDPEAVQLIAHPTLAGFALNGRKMFVPDAGIADYFVCAADVGLFLAPRGARGLTVSPLPAIDETRKLYQVAFENVPVAEEDILAIGDPARAALERALAVATVALAAEMVGGMQRVMEIAVEYCKARKQFGKPIGQFQAVQHLCADMLLLTESSRSAAYYAAWALQERAPEADAAVSIAKAYAGDAYREVGNRGIQVQGGMGFTWENNVHLYYKRAKASEVMFGDATYHRERIACLTIDKATDKAINKL